MMPIRRSWRLSLSFLAAVTGVAVDGCVAVTVTDGCGEEDGDGEEDGVTD